jgi:4-hydroxybenzoate polyprenyltransferase
LKILNFIFRWHISLAIAAVLLTLSAQIQLGMEPRLHPYLFLIFIGTLFEYNKYRTSILFVSGEALISGKHELIRKNKKKLWVVILFLGTGVAVAVLSTKINVLLTFLLLGFLTFFYSGIDFVNKKYAFKLREISYLKIFLISFIWSVSTILLPVIQTGGEIINLNIILLFSERFLFIFAIALQFDIRDMPADSRSGLKTIPLLIGRKSTEILSFLSLSAGFMVSVFHYQTENVSFILWPLGISFIITLMLIKIRFFNKTSGYFYHILDATVLLQGFLVLGFYYLSNNYR